MKIINLAIFKKTLFDFMKIKNIVIYLAIISLPLLLFSNLSEEGKMFLNLSMELKTEYLFGFFLIFSFFWVCGISISMLSIIMCSSFVAEEASDKTLLLMVSKPVSRTSMLFSKFLAFIVISLIFSMLSIFTSIYVWASAFNLDIYSLGKFFSLIPILVLYSVFVSILFGSLSAAISALFSSKIKVLIPMIAILMITFFAFIPIRGATQELGVYQSYFLDSIDLGYDLGNIYINTLESFNIKLIPFVQSIIGTFTGTYFIPKDGIRIDYDHGFILETLEKTGYHTLYYSFGKWIIMPIILISMGLIIFNKRDVH